MSAPTKTGKATEHFYGDFAISLVEEVTTPGGSEAAPTPLPLGSISAINGDIGPENLERFYGFDWAGGLFTSTASITDAQSSDKSSSRWAATAFIRPRSSPSITVFRAR